jgi:hypothetical protein
MVAVPVLKRKDEAEAEAWELECLSALMDNCDSEAHLREVVKRFIYTVRDPVNAIADLVAIAREKAVQQESKTCPAPCAHCPAGDWMIVEKNGVSGGRRCPCDRGRYLAERDKERRAAIAAAEQGPRYGAPLKPAHEDAYGGSDGYEDEGERAQRADLFTPDTLFDVERERRQNLSRQSQKLRKRILAESEPTGVQGNQKFLTREDVDAALKARKPLTPEEYEEAKRAETLTDRVQ